MRKHSSFPISIPLPNMLSKEGDLLYFPEKEIAFFLKINNEKRIKLKGMSLNLK